jgi:uncharacterized membrane protein
LVDEKEHHSLQEDFILSGILVFVPYFVTYDLLAALLGVPSIWKAPTSLEAEEG